MVATRRATRRRSESEAGNNNDEAPEKTSVEGSASLRTTRSRSRVDSFSNGIPGTCAEKTKSSETKLDMEESPEEQTVPDKSKTVDSVDNVAELQGDGDISEAESNCSSVSGLQTPSFIRITRRRQIVIPCQPEFPAKNRQSKKALPSEGSRCQEEDDISEAESCSSTVSGERAQHGTRMTRIWQAKINVSPVREAQTEEISDAESWCSGISTERSVHFKRVTRSMRLRTQAKTPLQSERRSEIVVAYTKLPKPVIPSQPIVISDDEQPTKSDSETEQTSLSSHRINEQPSPSKAKYNSTAVVNNEPKEFISSSPKKMLSKCIKKSPEKERPNDNNYESVDSAEEKVTRDRDTRKAVTKEISADVYEVVESPEEVCDRSLVKSTEAAENKSPVKCQDILSSDYRNFGQSDLSPRQTTPNKNKSNADSPKLDTRKISQSSLLRVEDIIDIDKPCEVGSSSQNDSIPSHIIESSDDECKTSVMNIDSDTSPEESVAESSSGITKTAGPEKSFTVSLLTSDENDSSENSDLEEIDKEETTSGNQSTSVLDKSHSEGLFVIDKTPGMDISKPYYLEETDVADDEQSEESSELEDSEEEFIDKDEDILNASNNILSLSSSIDPGLNIKHLGGLYISFDAGKQKSGSHGVVPLKEKKKDELLQHSIITPGFEKKECVPPLRESLHQLKKQRRAERAKTTGDGWFGMKAPEITDELKNDLKALKMRAAIDPKRFYKKNDREGLPKYFQVGTVVDSPIDFYHARIPKKQRKKNIVEELLADSEFRRYNKRKYQDIIAEKAALAAGKKNRKKKKFRK